MNITSKDFFYGGYAIFTVHNDKGDHYTYKIKRNRSKTSPLFVSLLTGPDHYSYIGILSDFATVYTTAKSTQGMGSKPVQVINWVLDLFVRGKPIPCGYGVLHEGKCCRCGRELTTPESIKLGMGPVCISKG